MTSMYLFYIDENVSGATYKFYDENNNEIQPKIGSKISSYKKISENGSNADKYYFVLDLSIPNIYWDRSPIPVETPAINTNIGEGKRNTNSIFKHFPSYTLQKNSIWNICKELNLQNYLSYNDWYIPSKDELDILITNIKNNSLSLTNIDIQTNNYWCSSQRNSRIYTWYWDALDQQWYANYKTEEHSALVIRSI